MVLLDNERLHRGGGVAVDGRGSLAINDNAYAFEGTLGRFKKKAVADLEAWWEAAPR